MILPHDLDLHFSHDVHKVYTQYLLDYRTRISRKLETDTIDSHLKLQGMIEAVDAVLTFPEKMAKYYRDLDIKNQLKE